MVRRRVYREHRRISNQNPTTTNALLMPDTPAIVGFVGFCEKVGERIHGGEWEEGDKEMVPCRYSRPIVRPGQGGLGILQIYLKSGGVPVVLGGAMISLWVGRWRS
jgi:hypothetical protein